MLKAKNLLESNSYTCVVIKGDSFVSSNFTGIMPIMNWIAEDSEILKDSYIADRAIGKAAALLMIYSNVKEVYAGIISEHALECFKKYNIPVSYTKKVPYILNRTQSGMCPMEQACLETSEPKEAYEILKNKLKKAL